jgi:hypothetical protein
VTYLERLKREAKTKNGFEDGFHSTEAFALPMAAIG